MWRFLLSLFLFSLSHGAWIPMTPEQAGYVECLKIVNGITEIACSQNFLAKPATDKKFKLEIGAGCKKLVTIAFGKAYLFIDADELEKLTQPAQITVGLDGHVESYLIKDLKVDKPIKLDNNGNMMIAVSPGQSTCVISLLSGYPVVEVAAATGSADKAELTLLAKIGIGFGVVLGLALLCGLAFGIYYLIRPKKEKETLIENENYMKTEELTGLPRNQQPRSPRKRRSKKKSKNASPRRRHTAEKKKKSVKPSAENVSSKVRSVESAPPKSAEQKKALDLRRKSRMSRLLSVLDTRKPDKTAKYSFMFAGDYNEMDKTRWSYFTTASGEYKGIEDKEKQKINEAKYLKKGPPKIHVPVNNFNCVLIEYFHNYLLNIHVISEEDWERMADMMKPNYPRRILDCEAEFLASYFDDAMDTWEVMEEKAAEIVKENFCRYMENPAAFRKHINSDKTSEFHGLCMFYKLYPCYIDAIKIEDRFLMRIPLQALIMLLLREDLTKKMKLKVLYWLKKSFHDVLHTPSSKQLLMAYPMNVVLEMDKYHCFERVEKEALEGTSVTFNESDSTHEEDWVFEEVYEDVEAKILKFKKDKMIQ